MLKLPKDTSKLESDSSLAIRGDIMGKTFIVTRSEDLLDSLKTIQTPTLFVWGDQDLLIPFREAKKMHQQNPSSKLISLPGGHEVIFRSPQKTVELIVQNIKN